jgi:hypothetical protein
MHTHAAMASTVMNVIAAKRTKLSIKRIRPAGDQTLQARPTRAPFLLEPFREGRPF